MSFAICGDFRLVKSKDWGRQLRDIVFLMLAAYHGAKLRISVGRHRQCAESPR
jgi:hypothetical protein